MRRTLFVVAALALAGCGSAQTLSEGERLNWRCAGGKEFSLRYAAGAAEVYAAGETHRLAPAQSADGARRYSNGQVEYVESGDAASLTGVYGGPYENCQRRRSDWWFRPW
jgi:hypothetical protein